MATDFSRLTNKPSMPRTTELPSTKSGAVTIPVCADKKAYLACMKEAVQSRDAAQIASCRNYCAPNSTTNVNATTVNRKK